MGVRFCQGRGKPRPPPADGFATLDKISAPKCLWLPPTLPPHASEVARWRSILILRDGEPDVHDGNAQQQKQHNQTGHREH